MVSGPRTINEKTTILVAIDEYCNSHASELLSFIGIVTCQWAKIVAGCNHQRPADPD